MKKILFGFILILIKINNALATAPTIPDLGLPGGTKTPDSIVNTSGPYAISLFIKYVAIISVISLMLSGIKYLISGGEEEKIKKAKAWIIWSLVGVFLSISAWGIINMINNIYISN